MLPSTPELLATWQGHGVCFQYPDIWELTEDVDGDDVIVTVAADDSCFWILRILAESPRPSDVLTSCLDAFRDEYEDVEIREVATRLADMPAQGRELEFSCYELLNTAELRCVRTLSATLLAWWQATDHELATVRAHFDRMSASVRIVSPRP